MIERLKLKNFTAFKELDMEFAPGVNLFIGANGTGKTHILKAMYAGVNGSGIKDDYYLGLFLSVFLPFGKDMGRLVNRRQKSEDATIAITILGDTVEFNLITGLKGMGRYNNLKGLAHFPTVYIPVKEMLANAPGFLSLYAEREIHFESVYRDILHKSFLPPLREQTADAERLMAKLQKYIGGKVVAENETFFVKHKNDKLEFTLVAEGLRKLGLLWLLIQNGCLSKGSVLFWDEPEANLNPELLEPLVEILLELQRLGVQMFLATHDYALLKLFDLKKKDHPVRFFSLRKDKEKGVDYTASDGYLGTLPNPISEASERLFVLEVQKRYKAQQQ
jgi:energy-coupling factor transporter ATP-binding protein EcfA2